MRIRTKICGITRPEDAVAAAEAGADAIGLVFYEGSPRNTGIEQAQAIAGVLPAFVTITALFVNPTPDFVAEILEKVAPDLLQFHGSEPPLFCQSFGRHYIKAIKIQRAEDVIDGLSRYNRAAGLLLDTPDELVHGGSGRTFDWSLAPQQGRGRIILAGGLNAGNVAEAIRLVQPYAVDVSSGVESSPGIKDHKKIQAFVSAVKSSPQNR